MPHSTPDTTITFGVVKRDLTGDSIPEVLSLTGAGKSIDDLAVTFAIQSSGRPRYLKSWRLTRASFDSRRMITDTELRTRLGQFGAWFFAESKFTSPAGFVSWLRDVARLHIPLIPEVIAGDMTPPNLQRARRIWEEMQAAGITVFEFSPGGDAIIVIGWSATDQRFYNLLQCC
jgi:hypothetical protein